jgi:predicted metal-dependent phosphoesterase TrpH
VHTRYSSDGHSEPADVVHAAERTGLFAIAVVDHNEPKGSLAVIKAARGHDLLVVQASEVSSFNGHILALGVRDEIPRDLSADETIERINDHGGLAVAAHPGRFYTGMSVHEARAASFSAIEVANGHSSQRQNLHARRLARHMNVGMTGGSDAHWPDDIGTCRTVFDTRPTSVDELLEAIRDRETRVVGEGLTFGEHTRLNVEMAGRWMRRGAKRI